MMKLRTSGMAVALAALAVGIAAQPAAGHEPKHAAEEAMALEMVPRGGRPVPIEAKRGQLNRQLNALKKFAAEIVTDLTDRTVALGRRVNAINRQRMLQMRDMKGGFGMRRWSDEKYAQAIDKALAEAEELLAEYKKLVIFVELKVTPKGLKLAAPIEQRECLADRRELVVLAVTNPRRSHFRMAVTGGAGTTTLKSINLAAKPRGVEYVFVPFKPGRFPTYRVALNCASVGGSLKITTSGPVKPRVYLTVKVINAATGKPCAARVEMRGADGRYAIANDRPVVLAGSAGMKKFGYVDGTVKAVFPAGKVKVKVTKGFEYLPAEVDVDLTSHKTITVALKRWVDMPARGWWAGDTHVHWVKNNWYQNGDTEWLNLHSRAEDLWVNNNLILKHWWKHIKTGKQPRGLVANRPNWAPVGLVRKYSTGGRVVWTSEEYRNDEIFGHMVFLRINKLIEPVSTGFMGGPDAVHWPPNSHTYDKVRKAGGISIPAHDVNNEVPIQAILGKMDAQDAHNTGRYYDLLNCGFRVPLSVGSDYPAAIMGFARVYVHCGEKLEYSKWVDNLAAGRTFVSSGAMVFLEADGKDVGDTIKLKPGETREIDVKASALCKNPLARLEIVHNGKPVQRIKAGGDGKKITFEGKITVAGPGWIAARTFSPGRTTWWAQPDVAHTSPIYITRGTERLVKAKSVKNLINVIKGARAKAAASRMYASDKQKQAVLDYFDNGVKLYEKLLESDK